MSKFNPVWEVAKTSLDLTDVFLFFTPTGGAVMIWGWVKTIPPVSLVGLLIIVVPLVIYAISRFLWKVKRGLKKPESLIFPYISKIDASQLKYGKNSIAISFFYPSALSYDLTFIKVRCCLIIAGNISTPEQEMAPLIVKKQISNQVYYPDFLLGEIPESIKEKMKNREAMEYRLKVRCWDSNNNEHCLNTELQQMIALA